jgi:hypothetical protein
MGRYDDAMRSYRRALRLAPNDTVIRATIEDLKRRSPGPTTRRRRALTSLVRSSAD